MSRSTPQNLEVLYEDNHLIAVNKRCGDLVQGDQTRDASLREILMAYLKEKYNKPGNVFLGVVHRLDRPTSGVVLFAKTSKALTRLNKMFKEKEVEKTYWALVQNPVPSSTDTLVHYLKKNSKNNTSKAYVKPIPESKKAILHYRVLKKLEHYSLLEINLETGRHHQIRVQMQELGCPIKGDLKYGSKRSDENGGIHLHARTLQIKHPVKDELLKITAPLPDDKLWNLC